MQINTFGSDDLSNVTTSTLTDEDQTEKVWRGKSVMCTEVFFYERKNYGEIFHLQHNTINGAL